MPSQISPPSARTRVSGQLGITADSKVVVYDDKSMKNAARVWWILKYQGVADVRLLNGEWQIVGARSEGEVSIACDQILLD